MKEDIRTTTMAKKVTQQIKLWGIVQGVGFRPFVAKLAERLKMKGEVRNIGGLVEIYLTDSEKHIDEFVKELIRTKPRPSEIVHMTRKTITDRDFSDFRILTSDDGDEEAAMIPADLAICPDCLSEMRDPDNVRFEHPFISCMVCGPRYTIIDRIPYDRENTSMVDFPMCEMCEGEYTDINDRRYHAQTISCHDCGPQMTFRLNEDTPDTDKTELSKAAALLKERRIIAFKSVGGYNLVTNPFSDVAVENLRKIKGREQKPFAIMFRNVEEIRQLCYMNEVEEKLITSAARPIVLLERKTETEMEQCKARNYTEFCKSRFVGAFLPSMGAQYILLDLFGGPLIFTSANTSGMPIIKDDEEMFRFMERQPLIAEAFYNERDIRVSVDDSVVRVIDSNPQMIRRSKGYAPVPLYMNDAKGRVLAVGPQLKNSFCLTKGPFAYLSQFFGDMDTVESQIIYEENVSRMEDLFRIKPELVACDMHPLYYTTKFAKEYAEKNNLPLLEVQHHHAHIASVMAEHDIEGPVIGVAFDGTGYGTDGKIWGGEFLLCEGSTFTRMSHLKYVKMIGGDSSMKEAWKSALTYMHAYNSEEFLGSMEDGDIMVNLDKIIEYANTFGTLEHWEDMFTEKALTEGINVIDSSSMGRLFDGVAAMLGIGDYNYYEGQCAMALEDAAARAVQDPGADEADMLALEFHMQIVDMIMQQCKDIREKTGIGKVALSGGTFQNKIIMEETLGRLRASGFEPYYNISVSPNDGGIALGQAFVAAKTLDE